MRRRAVLVGLGTALSSGCLTESGPGESSATTTDRGTGTRVAGAPATTTTPATTASDESLVVSGFQVSTTKVSPPEDYLLRTTASYSAEAVEREAGEQTVLDVSEIDDPNHRRIVERVLSEDRVWCETIPEGLRALTERIDFFTWTAETPADATHTHWGIGVYRAYPDRDPVVEFDADRLDDRVTRDDPGAIEFSLTNVGDRRQTVYSGTVPPFSVLRADHPTADRDALLWRNYFEDGCVSRIDGDSLFRCDAGVTTPIDPGETIARRYELRRSFDPEGLSEPGFDAPGRYVVDETLTYSDWNRGMGPEAAVDWTVTVDLEPVRETSRSRTTAYPSR